MDLEKFAENIKQILDDNNPFLEWLEVRVGQYVGQYPTSAPFEYFINELLYIQKLDPNQFRATYGKFDNPELVFWNVQDIDDLHVLIKPNWLVELDKRLMEQLRERPIVSDLVKTTLEDINANV